MDRTDKSQTYALSLLAVGLVVLFALTLFVMRERFLFSDKVLNVTEEKLTVVNPATGQERTVQIAPETKITVDGQPADWESLGPGFFVHVITEPSNDEQATEIRARSSSATNGSEPARSAAPEHQEIPMP